MIMSPSRQMLYSASTFLSVFSYYLFEPYTWQHLLLFFFHEINIQTLVSSRRCVAKFNLLVKKVSSSTPLTIICSLPMKYHSKKYRVESRLFSWPNIVCINSMKMHPQKNLILFRRHWSDKSIKKLFHVGIQFNKFSPVRTNKSFIKALAIDIVV